MSKVYDVNNISSREKILRTAERIFRAGGLAGLTTRRVAAEIGITAMAIYRHFQNKDELIQALVESGFQLWENRLAAAVDEKKPYKRLTNTLRAYREFATDERRYFELMYLIPLGEAPVAPASLATSPSPSFSAVIAAVRECMDVGEFAQADVGQTILLVWTTAHGLITLHFTGRFGYNDELFAATYDQTMSRLLLLLRS